MSWIFMLQIMIVIFWVGIVTKAAIGSPGDRFDASHCGPRCRKGHSYDDDCLQRDNRPGGQ